MMSQQREHVELSATNGCVGCSAIINYFHDIFSAVLIYNAAVVGFLLLVEELIPSFLYRTR